MRSQPKITIGYQPRHPLPGDTLDLELTLESATVTPVDNIELTFRGLESRRWGKGYLQHIHSPQGLDLGPHPLGEGERKALRARVALPPGIPPTFRGESSSIEYVLEVRVDIPWWPDAVEQYKVPVHAPPPAAETVARKPGLFSNAPDGPRGTELTLEVAIDDIHTTPGGLVQGAVAVNNVHHHRVAQLLATLIAEDRHPSDGAFAPIRVVTCEPLVLCEGKPENGVSYPIRFLVPSSAAPTFRSVLCSLVWRLEISAVVVLGSNVVVAPELIVLPARGDEAKGPYAPPPRAPPLGAERRALIWSQAASRCGLSADAEAETMTGTFGAVRLGISLELRKDRLWSVAKLEWPDVRLGANVTERRWTDALKERITTDDASFDERFVLRARDATQGLALLSRPLRASLLQFERVALDDDGAALASAGNGYTLEELERFARAAIEAARMVDEALTLVAAPAGLEDCRAAWAAQAEKLGGTFSAGDCSIRGARYRGFSVELLTRFEGAKPIATVARLLLASAPPDPLPPEPARVFASICAEVEGVQVTKDAVEATMPCPLPNPERAELMWRTLERLAKTLAPAAT